MPRFSPNKNTLKTFDPNKTQPFKIPEWATFSPGRSPEWKLHTRRGDAKNAFNWCRIGDNYGIILYHFENGMWVERCRQEGEPPETCQNCNTSVMEEGFGGSTRIYNRGQYIWDPRSEFKRLYVCRACRSLLK